MTLAARAGGGAAAAAAPSDRPGPVRPGEELPVTALAAWLDAQLPGPPAPGARPDGDRAAPGALRDGERPVPGAQPDGESPALTVEQFPGGHSNLTYLLRWRGRELVLRRPPVGASIKSAHDMGREHRVLSRLHPHYPKAPRALALCEDPAVAGAPFFLMERVRGVILRRPSAARRARPGAPDGTDGTGGTDSAAPAADPASTAPAVDPASSARAADPASGVPELPPARLRALSEAAVDALAELHAVDVAAAGLADLGRPAGYVARQVSGWSERWRRAATDPVPEVEHAAAWLAAHLPPRSPAQEEAGAALLHNDFKHDNLVLAADLETITAVLDWEMATVGEPLMDLGTSLGYWLDPDDEEALRLLPMGVTALAGNLSRREVVERYARTTGREVSEILFYYVFGLLKIAVIAQQIYQRYRSGLTSDQRFAPLLAGVRLLGRTADQAIARRRIDRLWD
jgi:aminoglycoside phosphotransferase (APT) family kinase protein